MVESFQWANKEIKRSNGRRLLNDVGHEFWYHADLKRFVPVFGNYFK